MDPGDASCSREHYGGDCGVDRDNCNEGFQAECGSRTGIGSCSKGKCVPTDEANCWLLSGVTALTPTTGDDAMRVTGGKIPATDKCAAVSSGLDVADGTRTGAIKAGSQAECCQECNDAAGCEVWVWATDDGSEGQNCWLVSGVTKLEVGSNRAVGGNLPEIAGKSTFDSNCRVVMGHCDTAAAQLCVPNQKK